MKRQKKSTVLLFLAVPVAVGALSGFLSGDIREVYEGLHKPPLAPPPLVFPVVWSTLYLLMGTSSYLVWKKSRNKASFWEAMIPYGLQLGMNFFWTILFFGMKKFLFASLWLVGMLAAIVWMCARFYRIDRTAAWLQAPYLLWTAFALYLSFGISFLNR